MSDRVKMLGQSAIGLALALASAIAANAATLSVFPVRADLNAKQPIGALTVRNDGSEPSVVQLETMAWTQPDGRDAYAPTREILANPPIFTVAPGGEQIVRIGIRRASDAAQELAYRVFLQEVPPPPPPGFKGTRVALRLGVPVFVAPAQGAGQKPAVQWNALATSDGVTLSLKNPGNVHVEVTHIAVSTKSHARAAFQGDVQGYVLPGQYHEWKIPGAAAVGSVIHVAAKSDAGPLEADVVVAGS